jgi:hypothetical protein
MLMMFFRHTISNRHVVSMLGVGLMLASSSCQTDECTSGAVRCVGKVAQTCAPRDSDDGTLVWFSDACGEGFCHLSTDPNHPDAFCAATADPDPSCSPQDSQHCAANEFVQCQQGFVVFTKDCTTGEHTGTRDFSAGYDTNGYCVSAGDRAICAMEASPNPLCSGQVVRQTVCDGNRVVSCALGYTLGSSDCPTTRVCVPAVPGEYAFCALSAELVPGCPLDSVYYPSCKDGQIVTCNHGYIDSQTPCPNGQTCYVTSLNDGYYECD